MTRTYPNKAATAAAACADSAAGLAKGFRSMAVFPPGSHDAYSPRQEFGSSFVLHSQSASLLQSAVCLKCPQ